MTNRVLASSMLGSGDVLGCSGGDGRGISDCHLSEGRVENK
jgi:hypothetical protein